MTPRGSARLQPPRQVEKGERFGSEIAADSGLDPAMKNTIPEVDAFIDRAADFAQPILKKLRLLFRHACPEIQETIKWSSPFFELKGIVGNMSDPEGILEKAGNTEMAGGKPRNWKYMKDWR